MKLPDGMILCFPKLIVMPSDPDDEDHTDANVLTHLVTCQALPGKAAHDSQYESL